tara:strand:- start:6664 stop:7860 length:1197 start_codon:yes stop_codon:yes gene_type:complete
MFQAGTYVGHKLCWPDDLVINSLWAWANGLGVSAHHGIVSTAYGVYRVIPGSGLDSAFLHNLVRSVPFKWELQYRSRGVWKSRLQMTHDRFLSAPLPIPSADEQAAIVKYLAHAHARIDRAIAAKRKLIVLLDEQKQAITHDAVTRGLDPSAPLTDSGIPWLGEIPAHWQVAALRFKYDQTLGKMLDSKRISGAHQVPYLRNTDVQWGRINTADLPVMDIREDEYESYTVRKGDLLVCEGGEVGRAAIWRNDGLIGFQKALHRLRPIGDEDPEFALLALRAAKRLGAFDTGRVSTIAHLTGEQLRASRFAWPPPDEQKGIVADIRAKTAKLDGIAVRVMREVELLREFRTRLTSDVVTGQLDVREIAATLPELTDEPLLDADHTIDLEDLTEPEDADD